VRHGIHQVCPGVVNSLGTPRSGSRPTPGHETRMNRIPSDLHDVCGGDGCSDGLQHQYIELLEGKKSKMPHEMLLRDSESTVHRIKI